MLVLLCNDANSALRDKLVGAYIIQGTGVTPSVKYPSVWWSHAHKLMINRPVLILVHIASYLSFTSLLLYCYS